MKKHRQANSGGRATANGTAALQILPAMPSRIRLLEAEKVKYTLETKNGEPIFRVHYSGKDDPPRQRFDESWNAFALRAAFERLKTPEDALAFLNTLGCPFRVWRDDPDSRDRWILPWMELEGWQMMVRTLRQIDPMEGWLGGFPRFGAREASRKEEILLWRSAVDILGHSSSRGMAMFAELVSAASDETYSLLQGVPRHIVIRRDMYLDRGDFYDIYATVEKSFPTPESRVPGSRGWQFAQSLLKQRQVDKARGTPELKQNLVAEIFTATPLDAILATVYVDKLRGRDLQVCALKDCDVTFETSDSRKMYCSQAHAHLASVRHKREEARQAKSSTKTLKAS